MPDQLLAQVGIFIELSLEGDPHVASLIRDRLAAAGDVDDCEPPDAQGDAGLDVNLLVVGPAMGDGAGHLKQPVFRKDAAANKVDGSDYAAHKSVPGTTRGPDRSIVPTRSSRHSPAFGNAASMSRQRRPLRRATPGISVCGC
jgi:hypothetical protein